MTPEQRYAEIEAREKAATPGEWTCNDHAGWAHPYVSVDAPSHTKLKDVINIRDIEEGGIGATYSTRGKLEIEIDNAKFIAHARADIPYLLARVRRAEELLRLMLDELPMAPSGKHLIREYLLGEGE